MKWLPRFLFAGVLAGLANLASMGQDTPAKKADPVPETVSYYKDVRPLFQQHCQGCHQPAKAQGGYTMTSYADLLKKTDNDVAGVLPGKSAESEVYRQIIAPPGKKPAMP